MKASTIRQYEKIMAPAAEKVIPKFNNAVVVVTAPRISTIGYCREINAEQLAHRPPIATKLRTGIFCKKGRLCLQLKQWDLG